MKTITKYLLRFVLVASIFTIVFRFFLSYGIENKSDVIMSISAVLYGVSMFCIGWYFGWKDGSYLPILDIGFRFHLATYIVHNTISILWIIFGLGAKYEKLNSVIYVGLYWGVFLFLHFIVYILARKNSIKGLNKEDIFE